MTTISIISPNNPQRSLTIDRTATRTPGEGIAVEGSYKTGGGASGSFERTVSRKDDQVFSQLVIQPEGKAPVTISRTFSPGA